MPDHLGPITADLLGLLLSAVLVGGYHLYLRVRLHRNPNYTIQAMNNRARAAWVEHLMGAEGKQVVGVQTLRNHTMAAVFLASTAVLLIMGVLNLGPAGLKGVVEQLHQQSVTGDGVWVVRLLPLLVDLFWAFFCFSLAIRANNHVGYLIGAGVEYAAVTPAYVAQLLNQGAGYYTLGMRAYYLAVPIIFGLFGPAAMVASTVVILALLYHADCVPESGAAQSAREGADPAPPDRFRVVKGQDV